MNTKDPRHITREELQCEMMVTSRNIEALKKKAPKLRRQHIKDLHRRAVKKGDKEQAVAILCILHCKACRTSWQRATSTSKEPRAHNVLTVKVLLDKTNQISTLNTEAEQDLGTTTDMDTPTSTRLHPLETVEMDITSTLEDQTQENNL